MLLILHSLTTNMTKELKAEAIDYLTQRYLSKARLYGNAYAEAVLKKNFPIARKLDSFRSRAERKLEELVSLA